MSHLDVMVGNSITHSVGQIFQPVFKLFAGILALIYSVVPNYAVAIAVLTIIIMGALTPLTVKSTKSMLAMQRLQPEIKKLQQKYKGPENRQQLNEEMMRLYREEKVNPAGGCLPMFIQFPFLIILYDIIRGLTNTVSDAKVAALNAASCHLHLAQIPPAPYASPRYIPNSCSFGRDSSVRPNEPNEQAECGCSAELFDDEDSEVHANSLRVHLLLDPCSRLDLHGRVDADSDWHPGGHLPKRDRHPRRSCTQSGATK